MNFDVFISYSSKDAAIANAACAALESAKIRCWIAPRDIVPSASWGASIVRAIDRCRVMVLIFSANANASSQVHREVDRAFSKGVAVVPLRIEDVLPDDGLAYYLDTVHWLDALTPPLERNLQKLVATVQALLPVAEPEPQSHIPASDEAEAAQAQDHARAEDERRLQDCVPPHRAEEAARRESIDLKAQELAEQQRRQREGQEKRRAEEDKRRKQAEAEAIAAKERDEEERLAREAEAKRRADQERAFASAKRADNTAPAPDAARERSQRLERSKKHVSRRALLIGAGVAGTGAVAAIGALTAHWYGSIRTSGLIRTLDAGSVLSMAIGPGGRTIYSGDALGLIKSWNPELGSNIGSFAAQVGPVQSMAVTPDGKWTLAGGANLRLISLEKSEARLIASDNLDIRVLAISPDSRIAVSASKDKLTVWELPTGRNVRTLSMQGEGFWSVAITPDGRGVVSSDYGTLKLWDLTNGKLIRTFSGHTGVVQSIAVTPDGRTALSGGGDWTLRLWDLASGSMIRVFEAHRSFVSSVAIAPDGRLALSGGADGTVRLWNLQTGTNLRTFTGRLGSLGPVSSVAITPDARTGLWGSSNGIELGDLT